MRCFVLLPLALALAAPAGAVDLINATPEELEVRLKAGDNAAGCELGNRLLRGRAMESNVPRGKELVSMAAEKGHAECQFYLGLMYKDGRWFPQQYEHAMTWIAKAAAQGLPAAQLELGMALEFGMGDQPRDAAGALNWYKAAALQSHSGAMYHYGRRLLDNEDLRPEGLAWLQLASEKGDFDAQMLLGRTPPAQGSDKMMYGRSLQRLRSMLKP